MVTEWQREENEIISTNVVPLKEKSQGGEGLIYYGQVALASSWHPGDTGNRILSLWEV